MQLFHINHSFIYSEESSKMTIYDSNISDLQVNYSHTYSKAFFVREADLLYTLML